eukprot:CAMPEP_0171122690 /NCGR_PEP_ID=MMETSP0766_2-20121228/105564_1 /TAXON_ID=439317 /ORGANISM="Gambierdiscus australes, Strain CAWD 149" /LENGTH=140 /DNA_ID=CAMNT_0011585541 /DNA_START=73 /DNA_END=496 /DNA_ORIENTATION=+
MAGPPLPERPVPTRPTEPLKVQHPPQDCRSGAVVLLHVPPAGAPLHHLSNAAAKALACQLVLLSDLVKALAHPVLEARHHLADPLTDKRCQLLLKVGPQLCPEDRCKGLMQGLRQGAPNSLLQVLGQAQGFESLLGGNTT